MKDETKDPRWVSWWVGMMVESWVVLEIMLVGMMVAKLVEMLATKSEKLTVQMLE